MHFREPIGFPVPDVVPAPVKFGGRLRELVEEHGAFMQSAQDQERVQSVLAKVEEVSALVDSWARPAACHVITRRQPHT